MTYLEGINTVLTAAQADAIEAHGYTLTTLVEDTWPELMVDVMPEDTTEDALCEVLDKVLCSVHIR